MQRGYRKNREAQGLKLDRIFIASGAIGFVSGNKNGSVGAVEQAGHLFIHRQRSSGNIGHKNDGRGVFDCHFNLLVGAVNQNIAGRAGVD